MEKPAIILIRNAQRFDFGGGERFPVFVSQAIQDRYTPIIISRSPRLIEYAANEGIRVVRGLWWSNQQWSGIRLALFPVYILWQFILTCWYLVAFLRLHPRAVHIQSKDDFIGATFAAKILGITVVWTDHADLKHIWRNLRLWYKNPVGKWVYVAAHLANSITVISRSEQSEVTAHLPKHSQVKSRILMVNNGAPDVRDQYTTITGGAFTFCSTNRLVRDKGIGEMITAFQQFNAAYPHSRLVLVGNGPEEPLFRKLAGNTDTIEFAGYQPDPLAFVAQADVLLQPTYHEGFSISILEGFMMQKPVIATNVGGNLEMIVDDKNGILVPIRDAQSLYLAMERLYKSPRLRERIALAGRQAYTEKYVFNTIVTTCFVPLYEHRGA